MDTRGRRGMGRVQKLPMDRPSIVHRMRGHLERTGYPRLQLCLLIVGAGVAAFLVSFALLAAGVHSMAVRYGVAGVAGYLAFLALVAVWIAWKRHRFRPELDVDGGHVFDALDLGADAFGRSTTRLFEGGRSGGGGASESWMSARAGGGGRGGSSWADELGESVGLVILLVAAIVGGIVAIGYVVYLAPALLAEVFVDAVIIAAVSKRLAHSDRRDWTATLLRRTWMPALALIALLIVSGWALQRLAPEARSIGPALASIRE